MIPQGTEERRCIPLGACFFVGAAAAEIWQRLVNGEPEAVEERHGRGGVASTGRVRQRRKKSEIQQEE